MARKPRIKKQVEYNVRIRLDGFPAYTLDKIVESGIYGSTREEVTNYIIRDWSSQRWKTLSDLGVKIEEAIKLGYVPKRR